MKFKCKEISINDEELGCTITLSDRKVQNNYDKNMTVEEILNSLRQYILLQRTYPEDEFEEDFYYFETSEFEKSGELDDFEIILSKNSFILTIESDIYEIQINPSKQKWDELKDILKKITVKKGKLIIK
ncbi:MAG: hypothetical protein IT238_03890 [Bacteroidia bacterium]|nr:hypothetical protein [Bacteroidia bacterium]MCZ2247213.1 hypothetical protein [Bacteroidia bacterium]